MSSVRLSLLTTGLLSSLLMGCEQRASSPIKNPARAAGFSVAQAKACALSTPTSSSSSRRAKSSVEELKSELKKGAYLLRSVEASMRPDSQSLTSGSVKYSFPRIQDLAVLSNPEKVKSYLALIKPTTTCRRFPDQKTEEVPLLLNAPFAVQLPEATVSHDWSFNYGVTAKPLSAEEDFVDSNVVAAKSNFASWLQGFDGESTVEVTRLGSSSFEVLVTEVQKTAKKPTETVTVRYVYAIVGSGSGAASAD